MIYLDNSATTRPNEACVAAMNELLTQFIVENRDAVNERLAPFGITIDRIMQPLMRSAMLTTRAARPLYMG